MRSEDGFTVWDVGDLGEARADAVGPVVVTESAPYVGILEGVGWATAVAAAEASAEPVPTSVGMAKTQAKSLSAAGTVHPRPRQRSTVVTDAQTRATKPFERAQSSSTLIRGPCVRKSQNSVEVKGSSRKTALSVRGTSPPKPTRSVRVTSPHEPTPRNGEERVLARKP